MTSLTDLDQGGIARRWIPEYMGPSIGTIWVPAVAASVYPIAAPGTYVLDRSITKVNINMAGQGTAAVVVQLPQSGLPPVPAVTLPGDYAQRSITIVDVGGNASNITIVPAPGENIMGLASILLTTSFGGYTLSPVPSQLSWSVISP